jgi:hypothetical protein
VNRREALLHRKETGMVMRTTAIALSLAAAGAANGAGLDADTMRNFGGRYAADCAVAGGLSLRVEPAALVIDVRGRTITGANVQASYSFYGQSPPPGFAVALQSELRDGKELVFLVHQDASGQRIELQADAKLMAALGAMATQKYRDCDDARNKRVAAAARGERRQAAAAADAAARDTTDPLNHPRLKQAYLKALGARASLPWLAKLEGPGPERKRVRVEGAEYTQVAVCKPHDCYDNSALVLFSIENNVVYGKVLDRQAPVMIGAPSPAMAAALEKSWRSEFRQGR